jgi:flagellar hook-associated protein 3 FlgL
VSSVQISDSTSVQTSDSGAAVFLSVTPQTASPVPAATAGNTGTATIGAVSTNGASAAAESDGYSINFTVDPTTGNTTYTVTDTSTNTVITPVATATAPTYTSGASIALGSTGMSVAISGTPANNDSFTVTPAAKSTNSDIFSTIQSMITALQTPADTPTETATLQNSLTAGLTQVENTLNNVSAVQATVGGREQQIQAMQTVNETQSLQNTTSLSGLVSTNLTQTISEYTQTQYSLQASEEAFAQVSQLSLFQYIQS